MVDWERGVTWFGRVVCGDVTAEANKFLACGGKLSVYGYILEIYYGVVACSYFIFWQYFRSGNASSFGD
jgi:hypothetical protein